MSRLKYTGRGQHLFVLEDAGGNTERSRGTCVETQVAAGWATSLSAGVYVYVFCSNNLHWDLFSRYIV